MKISSQALPYFKLATPAQALNNAKNLMITALALTAISYLPAALGGRCEDACVNCVNFCLRVSDFRATAVCTCGCQIGYLACKLFSVD